MEIPHSIKKFFTTKIVLLAIGLLSLLVLVMFLFSRCGDSMFRRDIEKKKDAVEQGLANVANREAQIAEKEGELNVLREMQDAEKANVTAATKEYLDAANVAGEARREAEKAVANVQNARNANATNVSVQELQEKLKNL